MSVQKKATQKLTCPKYPRDEIRHADCRADGLYRSDCKAGGRSRGFHSRGRQPCDDDFTVMTAQSESIWTR